MSIFSVIRPVLESKIWQMFFVNIISPALNLRPKYHIITMFNDTVRTLLNQFKFELQRIWYQYFVELT